ncbi:MFS transporter [Flavobacterium gilvum]|uniref:MFS transporter n=1 Tax=Flavobacterium gilvum TaxID=1492737 RepID=A0AAC9I3M4_9FLAO|nr:MFS transporter [Flavobacterium gilvum]AOW09676.1 MFS transporter [Flavobacterium gilvum]KFC60793.1 major facilitator superfamily MFS_1 [Flavobacterium gilvum]
MKEQKPQTPPFTAYQKFAVFILAITQFTVILDFMVMSPLGDILMKSLSLKPSHFGLVVSAYAFSAGISGLLTAGFADKFDRKKLLLFFYGGFIAGTIMCGIVNSYYWLVAARIITGLFGGVIGSISMAIVADLFSIQQRGRVMGFIQMGFGASQILGIPIGLYLANAWGWHAPFLWVAGMAGIVAFCIAVKLNPITQHLSVQLDKSPFEHLKHTIAKKDYRIGFTATALLSVGGFMMMPFGSAFAINNLHITQEQLPMLFMIAGISTLLVMPLIGKLSDRIDKYKIFVYASIWTMIMIGIYTNLGVTVFGLVAVANVLMMIGVMGRMVPSTALVTSIPEMQDRGAFMSINSSLQQIAGGIAAAFAGTIVVQKDKWSPLEHYDTLGIIIICISILTVVLMYRVNKMVKRKNSEKKDHSLTIHEV